MTNRLISLYDIKQFPYRLNWVITQECDFNCFYCIQKDIDKSAKLVVYSPKEIKAFFDKTQVSWLIMITGGEPFKYPNFVDVCAELVPKHIIQITTNLNDEKIFDFANRIQPENVHSITASYHKLMRRGNNQVNDFIDKCLYLKQKGFPLLVNYVSHPLSLPNMVADIKFFNELCIDTYALAFRGTYNGKVYPQAYTKKEIDMISRYIADNIELKFAYNELNYFGYYCAAGRSYFFMDKLGNVSRCVTLHKKLGNLFNNDFKIDNKIKPCIASYCIDCYNGMASVTNRKASKFNVWLEKRKYSKQ